LTIGKCPVGKNSQNLSNFNQENVKIYWKRFTRQMSELLVDETHYTINEAEPSKAGRGPLGDVYKGTLLSRNVTGPIDVAIFISREEDFTHYSTEVETLRELDNPGCLKLLGFSPRRSAESESPVIITKWMPNRSLEHALEMDLKGNPVAGWNATKKSICVFGIAAILQYLHSKNIIHCDVRPGTFLLNEKFEPVLCDFSRPVFGYYRMVGGTLVFMAPESAMDGGQNKMSNAVDIYAFGVSLVRSSQRVGNWMMEKVSLRVQLYSRCVWRGLDRNVRME
jgi:serine/threonine protein kinase